VAISEDYAPASHLVLAQLCKKDFRARALVSTIQVPHKGKNGLNRDFSQAHLVEACCIILNAFISSFDPF
jgi:hypothetical protein